MKIEELNSFFRNFFKKLVDDGYKKRRICALTLGSQNEPQFEGFLNGKDFGIKPLSRLIDAFDYDIEIVLVPKDNNEMKKSIRESNHEILNSCCSSMLNRLNTFKVVRTKKSEVKSNTLDQIVQDLLTEIS